MSGHVSVAKAGSSQVNDHVERSHFARRLRIAVERERARHAVVDSIVATANYPRQIRGSETLTSIEQKASLALPPQQHNRLASRCWPSDSMQDSSDQRSHGIEDNQRASLLRSAVDMDVESVSGNFEALLERRRAGSAEDPALIYTAGISDLPVTQGSTIVPQIRLQDGEIHKDATSSFVDHVALRGPLLPTDTHPADPLILDSAAIAKNEHEHEDLAKNRETAQQIVRAQQRFFQAGSSDTGGFYSGAMDHGRAVDSLHHMEQSNIIASTKKPELDQPTSLANFDCEATQRFCNGVPEGLPPPPEYIRNPNSMDFARPRYRPRGMIHFVRGESNAIMQPMTIEQRRINSQSMSALAKDPTGAALTGASGNMLLVEHVVSKPWLIPLPGMMGTLETHIMPSKNSQMPPFDSEPLQGQIKYPDVRESNTLVSSELWTNLTPNSYMQAFHVPQLYRVAAASHRVSNIFLLARDPRLEHHGTHRFSLRALPIAYAVGQQIYLRDPPSPDDPHERPQATAQARSVGGNGGSYIGPQIDSCTVSSYLAARCRLLCHRSKQYARRASQMTNSAPPHTVAQEYGASVPMDTVDTDDAAQFVSTTNPFLTGAQPIHSIFSEGERYRTSDPLRRVEATIKQLYENGVDPETLQQIMGETLSTNNDITLESTLNALTTPADIVRYEATIHAAVTLREWWSKAYPELYMLRAICQRNMDKAIMAITNINYWLDYVVAQMPWRFSRLQRAAFECLRAEGNNNNVPIYFKVNEYFCCGSPSCEAEQGDSDGRMAPIGCHSLMKQVTLLFFAPGSAAGTNLKSRIDEMRSLHALIDSAEQNDAANTNVRPQQDIMRTELERQEQRQRNDLRKLSMEQLRAYAIKYGAFHPDGVNEAALDTMPRWDLVDLVRDYFAYILDTNPDGVDNVGYELAKRYARRGRSQKHKTNTVFEHICTRCFEQEAYFINSQDGPLSILRPGRNGIRVQLMYSPDELAKFKATEREPDFVIPLPLNTLQVIDEDSYVSPLLEANLADVRTPMPQEASQKEKPKVFDIRFRQRDPGDKAITSLHRFYLADLRRHTYMEDMWALYQEIRRAMICVDFFLHRQNTSASFPVSWILQRNPMQHESAPPVVQTLRQGLTDQMHSGRRLFQTVQHRGRRSGFHGPGFDDDEHFITTNNTTAADNYESEIELDLGAGRMSDSTTDDIDINQLDDDHLDDLVPLATRQGQRHSDRFQNGQRRSRVDHAFSSLCSGIYAIVKQAATQYPTVTDVTSRTVRHDMPNFREVTGSPESELPIVSEILTDITRLCNYSDGRYTKDDFLRVQVATEIVLFRRLLHLYISASHCAMHFLWDYLPRAHAYIKRRNEGTLQPDEKDPFEVMIEDPTYLDTNGYLDYEFETVSMRSIADQRRRMRIAPEKLQQLRQEREQLEQRITELVQQGDILGAASAAGLSDEVTQNLVLEMLPPDSARAVIINQLPPLPTLESVAASLPQLDPYDPNNQAEFIDSDIPSFLREVDSFCQLVLTRLAPSSDDDQLAQFERVLVTCQESEGEPADEDDAVVQVFNERNQRYQSLLDERPTPCSPESIRAYFHGEKFRALCERNIILTSEQPPPPVAPPVEVKPVTPSSQPSAGSPRAPHTPAKPQKKKTPLREPEIDFTPKQPTTDTSRLRDLLETAARTAQDSEYSFPSYDDYEFD